MRIIKVNGILIGCKVVKGRPKAKVLNKAPEGVEVIEILSGYGLTVANFEFSPYSYGPATMSTINYDCVRAVVGEASAAGVCVLNHFPNSRGTIVYARSKRG